MRALAVLIVVAGCAKTASELSPFPCADDLTCPAGLGCVAGQCQTAVLDAICTAGSDPTDCSVAAAGAVCSKQSTVLDIGACEVPCGAGCAAGRACSFSDNHGFCLVDCNGSSTVCPPNTICLPRDDGHKVCTPPSIGCRTVSNARRCTSRFCESRSTEVTCPDGVATCPEGATCSSNSRSCTCDDNRQPIACDNDQPCNSACGGNRHWWCAPQYDASCFGDLTDFQLTCECWAGSVVVDCDRQGVTCDELCRDL
ncbi:MAG TPA: hypothetical protein VMZ53_08330 [Kofleriaceae bacterium]|nr:hypothetical protein [Kofleriaceae bacterium]